MRPHAALAVVLLLVPLAGCADTGPAGTLEVTIEPTAFTWGRLTNVTLHNPGPGSVAAPVTVEFVAANGTAVRTIGDVTLGRGMVPDQRVRMQWNGSNDDGRLVLWGEYTVRASGSGRVATGELTILEPPTFGMTVDPIPREAPAGEPRRFVVNNTGNQVLAGELVVAAGREDTIVFQARAPVQLNPGSSWTFNWDGTLPGGGRPDAKVYALGARLSPDDGRSDMTATDWFRVT